MDELFLKLVNMSISAAWAALAVMALRVLLRKAPKWLWPALWGCVGLRLVLPVSIESALSLIPSAETVPPEIVYQCAPAIQSGVGVVDRVVNPIVGAAFAPGPGVTSINPLQVWLLVCSWVWAVGVFALLCYAVFSWLRLRRRVGTAVRLRGNIYQSEGAETPFVLGLFHPRIYLPFSLTEGAGELVIAHEQAHIARKDHWIKPVGYLLLCVYWFNPILWAAYVLLCRDIELACDERVVQTLTADQRADYSQALLSCSVNSRTIAVCPLAFGEVGVKERVKLVLNYKKPSFWVAAIAVVCCIVAAVCFLTDPPAQTVPLTPETAKQTIAAVLGSLHVEGESIMFAIPEELPVPEDENTRLTITLNETYSYPLEPGTYSVGSSLVEKTGWTAGQHFMAMSQLQQGWELVKVMLRVAYMTQVGENSYHEYAADYVELSAPFFDLPVASMPSVELVQEGRDLSAYYLLRDGSQFALSLTLPEGVTAQVDERDVVFAPNVIMRDQNGNQAGVLDICFFGIFGIENNEELARYEGVLAQVDTAKNELPMQIFAPVAMNNHAYFDGYTVVKHSATGASAVSRWMWQDLSTPGYEGAAVAIPFQGMDCVLAYDWSVTPYFVQMRLTDGMFTPDQLNAIAESVTFR